MATSGRTWIVEGRSGDLKHTKKSHNIEAVKIDVILRMPSCLSSRCRLLQLVAGMARSQAEARSVGRPSNREIDVLSAVFRRFASRMGRYMPRT